MAGPLSSPRPPSTTVRTQQEGRPRWKRVIDTASKWLGSEDNGEWLKDMRGYLAMVATVIATMTFQVGLNPPGGVAQNGENGLVDCPRRVDNKTRACPGESVYATAYGGYYFYFMLFNNISFFSSLVVCLWLISGLPINHRFPTWLLSIGMCVSLTSLAITYLYGAIMITPELMGKTFRVSDRGVKVWYAVVAVAGLFLIMRFFLLFWSFWDTKGSSTGDSPTTTTSTGGDNEAQVNQSNHHE